MMLSVLPVLAVDTVPDGQTITLRAWGVPSDFGVGPAEEARRQVIEEFRSRYPWIDPVSSTGLMLPGLSTMDVVPMMQIAGGVPEHVLYVNFRQSETFISKKLLYPLDHYLEQLAGVSIPDGSALDDDAYIDRLRQGPNWAQIALRVPDQCWQVIRRECPYQEHCRYRAEDALPPLAEHEHIWAYPVGPLVVGLSYDKSLFAEYADQGVQPRAPRDWDEMLRWCQIMTDPARNHMGLNINVTRPAWAFLSFLYSAGGRVVEQNEQGEWYCVLDTPEAVEAAWFYSRLRLEKITRNGKTFRGVMGVGDERGGEQIRFALQFAYLDSRMLDQASNQNLGFGPVPLGPTGTRGSEFNSMMCGIFSGLADDQRMRDAAWKYIQFYDGIEARQIQTDKMIEAGLGRFVRPELLRFLNTDGRYDPIIAQIPAELEMTYKLAFEAGVPEPYGKNCQYVYNFMLKPLGAIWQSGVVAEAVDAYAAAQTQEQRTAAKKRGEEEIQRILSEEVEQINQKMLGILPPAQQRTRNIVAGVVIFLVVIIFIFVLRLVFKAFRPPGEESRQGLQLNRFYVAYLLMAPGVLSIALWMYWPLVKGTIIAFQDYSVLGDSEFVGLKNFADVLFDNEFWHSLLVSLNYALLFMCFGFGMPIVLALLLQEVPRGKIFFRMIYYLPAVLSGLVVIFLWKSFYSSDGLINAAINSVIVPINTIFETDFDLSAQNWLQHSPTVLFWCLLPTVWAGMGPGCLIYLAALKTVPDELYEAGEMDGAGIFGKIRHIAIPSIKSLVLINFIGAMIGAIRGAGGFMLAMTGGGPYDQSGGATEVIGLRLWITTFGYLKFGTAAAMAWVVGSMLIGFTVLQLQRLNRLEFRTAEKI